MPTQRRSLTPPAALPPSPPFLSPQLTGSAQQGTQQGGAEARAQGEGAWEQTKGKATEMGHRAGGCLFCPTRALLLAPASCPCVVCFCGTWCLASPARLPTRPRPGKPRSQDSELPY